MNQLTCLQPGWKPPEDSGFTKDRQEQGIQWWKHAEERIMVSVDHERLVMSYWPTDAVGIPEMMHVAARCWIEELFIGDQRPKWLWERGRDVANMSPHRLPKVSVYAWHLKDPATPLEKAP